MRLVSVNLNKRLQNGLSRTAFETWLARIRPALILCQEPLQLSTNTFPTLDGFHLLGGNHLTAAWTATPQVNVEVVTHSERWQEIRLEGLFIHNVYLSPDSGRERRQFLEALTEAAKATRPAVIIGDFNLAPGPEDGRFGDEASKWNTTSERAAFKKLLNLGNLIDSTSHAQIGNQEFTVERIQTGKQIRFRCDLALLSKLLQPGYEVSYDHSPRLGPAPFTDHVLFWLT